LDNEVAQHYPSDGAGAVVYVQHKDQVLLHKAYGLSNIEFGLSAQEDMKFRIASITKQFTAVAILMLMEQGKLKLGDDIKVYVPEYSQAQQKKITINQLLTHTAGIPGYDNLNGYTHHGTDRDSIQTIIDVFKDEPLDFEPGTNFRYSNSGYVLLGKIIENISEVSYGEFIQQKVLTPLGMQNTSLYDFYKVVPNLSKGYEVEEGGDRAIVHAKAVKPGGVADGEIISTVDDLAKWYRAIHANQLISAQSKDIAFTSHVLPNGNNTHYGLGWNVATIGQYKTAEHGGNNHGTEGYAMMVPDQDLIIIVLSNLNRSYPSTLVEKLAAHVLDIDLGSVEIVNVQESLLNKYAGRYQYNDGPTRSISIKDNHLYSQLNNGEIYVLDAVGKTRFVFQDSPEYWIEFIMDENENVMRLKSGARTIPVSTADKIE
jgi:CubicO group peptidase (beta-lactamase class C family)